MWLDEYAQPECTDYFVGGRIELDTKMGKMLGFTRDRFGDGSYLWLERFMSDDDAATADVWICALTSIKNGSFSQLLKNIKLFGWKPAVTNPSYPMKTILSNKGYTKQVEKTKYGYVDVWRIWA